MRWGRRGQVGFYFSWLVVAVIIVIVGGVIAPMGVEFNTEMFRAGERILLDANESVQLIQNTGVRESWSGMIDEAVGASDTNIQVSSDLFQYSWVLLLVVSVVAVFLVTRRSVEYGAGGLV